MFHRSPLLLFGFLIGVGLLVALFGKLGLGTNTVLPAIAISAAVIGVGSWGWKRFFRGKRLPDKKVMFKALTTGTTRPASQRALVQYQSQYMDRYGVNAGARGAPTNEVYEDEEFEDEEFEDEEFEDEEFEDEEFEDEEFEDEEFEDEEFEDEDFNDERPDRVVVEEVQVERYQPRAYPRSSPTGPHGMREQRATFAPMNARPPLPGQRDAASLMQLAKDLMFHPDKMLSGRVSIFGLPNSGKSNLVAKLCEELGREELDVPFVLADTEDEYSQLVDVRRTWLKHGYTAGSPTAFADGATPPPHFIAVDPAGAYYFGQMVLEQGFQVVLNLESYETEEEAAIVMCEVVRGMRDWEQEQISDDRVSCFFILEEAATWLPQNTQEIKERLTPQTLSLLQSTMFNTMVRKGRKRGLGFIFATQRPAEIDKRAMKSSWRFLMWQTEKNDLDVYEEMCPQLDRTKVQQFRPGEAVVMGPGILMHTRLFERRSPDCAKTPGLASVRRRYGNGQRPRYDTRDLAEYLRANATRELPGTKQGSAALPRTQTAQEALTEERDPRVVPFVHPSQQPKANSREQLAWGCAVLHYLNEKREPWTETSVRKPRPELRSLALALGIWKDGAAEIIGGGDRAKKIKEEVDQLPGPRMLELLRLAQGVMSSYRGDSPELAHQAES